MTQTLAVVSSPSPRFASRSAPTRSASNLPAPCQARYSQAQEEKEEQLEQLEQNSSASASSSSSVRSNSTNTMGRPHQLARTRSGEQPVAFKRDSWTHWAPSEYRLNASTHNSSNGKAAALEQPLSPTLPDFCAESTVMASSPSACSTCSSSSSTSADIAMHSDEDDEFDEPCSSASSSASSLLGEDTDPSSCSSSSSAEDLPSDCFPSSASSPLTSSITPPPSQWRHRSTPFTFPGPTPTNKLGKTDLESCLRFASPSANLADADACAPPAFFPLQRVSFAPQLKIKTPGGVPLAIGASSNDKTGARDGIAGMMLGVTGVIEVLDAEKTRRTGKEVVRTSRMIADFATDLTNGLKIWKRDAAPIVREKLRVEREYRARKHYSSEELEQQNWDEMLAPGTYMLPLSMKIPCSEKLPPSFESSHYRIRYTMSLAVFSSRKSRDGRPEILHVHSVPFHILPSTLPTPAPHIPTLTHDARKGGFLAGLSRALSLSVPSANGKPASDKTCTHIVCPSIPTTTYSPGSVIPISLKIADCPTEPTDLYIRLSLIRKVYVRDSAYEMMNEWGLPEEMFFEEFCKEEEEIVSRWGYVPYSLRAKEGATPGSKAQVIISDITLPVGGPNGEWTHGYSSQLDLGPAPCPTMRHGECSWFSPALTGRSPAKADYDRYVHASARHYISIEVGFASDKMKEVLAEIGDCVPEMEIPQPNNFTMPQSPASSSLSGLSTVNPFPAGSHSSSRTKRSGASPFQHAPQLPSFPGKLKEILIPVIIGSVAEPQMACIVGRANEVAPVASVIPPSPSRPTPASTPEQSAERAARDVDESEVERYERVGDDGEEAWLCPPPSYRAAVSTVPAYV